MNKLSPKTRPGNDGYPGPPPGPRLLYADHIRIAAILAVVVLHVSTGVVISYGRIGPLQWLAGNVADSFCRWGVPVFAMLSGALLLGPSKDDSPALFFSKRMRRVLAPMLFWSVFCYGWYRLGSGEIMTLGGAVRKVVLGSHLYYLFILAAIYCITPWLRRREWGWALPLSFLAAGAVNAAVYYFVAPPGTQTGRFLAHFFVFAAAFIGYFTAGQLLLHVPASPRRPLLFLGLAAVSSALTAAGTFLLVRAYGPEKTGLYLYDYFSPTVMAASFAVFMFFRSAAGSRTEGGGPSGSLVRALADSSFGVYLMHPFVQEALGRCGEAWQGKGCLSTGNPWLGIPFFSAAVYCICVALTAAIRRIPYLRAVVGR